VPAAVEDERRAHRLVHSLRHAARDRERQRHEVIRRPAHARLALYGANVAGRFGTLEEIAIA